MNPQYAGDKSRLATFLALSSIVLILALSSCSRTAEGTLKLQANPILTGGLGWAVVRDAYVRLKEGPADSSSDLDHLRRGSVYRLDSRKLSVADPSGRSSSSDLPGIWYGLEADGFKGWVREAELDIYSSQAQAEKAAAAYR